MTTKQNSDPLNAAASESGADAADVEARIREAYEGNKIYKVDTVCLRPRELAKSYVERLVEDRIVLTQRYMRPGPLLDVCCATGDHLFSLCDSVRECIGIDFSRPFIERARQEALDKGLGNVRFEVADAREIPLPDHHVGTAYSFSSLYAIPHAERAVAEIARVLKPGGACILDFGNRRSLNALCIREYKDIPPTFLLSIESMLDMCRQNGLRVIEHRRYQLLPLWAEKPRWLWPLLHPMWKRIMAVRVGGRMVDERISSLPILRQFAFRHLVVCIKDT